MNKTALIIGIVSVILALGFYTITLFLIHKKNMVSKRMLITQGFGLSLDIIGTTAMFLIQSGISISFHGIIGFVALGFMIVEFVLLIKLREQIIDKSFLIYSKVAYITWLIVFFFGMSM